MKLENQVAIVTGASRGIGKAIAETLAAEGAKVACIATTEAGAAKVAEAIGGKGYACNVGDSESVKTVFAQIETELGTPAILVNNAGITRDNLLMRMSDDEWDDVIRINLKGAFNCSKAVARSMMKARFGRIINIASISGTNGLPGQSNYSASKAGMLGLTMSLAKELGSRGITVNAIAPGFIETDMTEDLPEDFREWVKKTSPLGRLGSASDIADAVMFLAGPGAGYITGQTLTVDGGLML
jgi:3-oxoacyl-[acyl-carrier protein] reductase